MEANREKAEGWLERNAIVVTALNPVIGYQEGAALVKLSLKEGRTVREIAVEKAEAGQLKHVSEDRQVLTKEIEAALSDLGKLTRGGIFK